MSQAQAIAPDTAYSRKMQEKGMFAFLRLSAWFNVAVLAAVCLYLCYNGLPVISLEFLTEAPRNMMTEGGILPCRCRARCAGLLRPY